MYDAEIIDGDDDRPDPEMFLLDNGNAWLTDGQQGWIESDTTELLSENQ
jgi:hypothetical protein